MTVHRTSQSIPPFGVRPRNASKKNNIVMTSSRCHGDVMHDVATWESPHSNVQSSLVVPFTAYPPPSSQRHPCSLCLFFIAHGANPITAKVDGPVRYPLRHVTTHTRGREGRVEE